MPSVTAAAAHIKLAVAPVVFLDTCVLLDIVRAPLRNAPGNVETAVELLLGATRPSPSVYLIVACPTPTEWDDHIHQAVEDCVTAVKSVSAVSDSCGFVGLPALGPLPAVLSSLPDRLKTISKDLLDASILLDKDGEALGRALDRIIKALRPAKKGGKGAKDAAILEHAVSLVDELLVGGFAEPRVFVSSNTDDFAAGKAAVVHPDIKGAFDPPRDIHYSVSLSAATAWLKAGGWVP